MKRIVYILVTVSLLVSLLAIACGEESEASKVKNLVKKETDLMNKADWQNGYELNSPSYRAACSYQQWAQYMNETLVLLRTMYGTGKFGVSDIEVRIDGNVAYATYKVKIDEAVIMNLTLGSEDLFININGKWYDVAESVDDPGYNESDAAIVSAAGV